MDEIVDCRGPAPSPWPEAAIDCFGQETRLLCGSVVDRDEAKAVARAIAAAILLAEADCSKRPEGWLLCPAGLAR